VIPKRIALTSKAHAPGYLKDTVLSALGPGWEFYHTVEEDVPAWFAANPLDEFPNIIERWNLIRQAHGEHGADLFRYYYLYINGGVFVDADAMPAGPLDDLFEAYDFIAAYSCAEENTAAIAYTSATPRNEIIYRALVDAYTVDSDLLASDYFLFCKNMKILAEHYMSTADMKICMLQEEFVRKGVARAVDKNNTPGFYTTLDETFHRANQHPVTSLRRS